MPTLTPITAALSAATFAVAAWALNQPVPAGVCAPPVVTPATSPSPLPSQADGYRAAVPTEFPGP